MILGSVLGVPVINLRVTEKQIRPTQLGDHIRCSQCLHSTTNVPVYSPKTMYLTETL